MDQNTNGMNDNNQPNQPYGQPNQPYMNNGYQPQYGEVKDIFCNILLVIMPLRLIIGIIINVATFSAMNAQNIMDGSYLTALTGNAGYNMLSILSNLLFVAYVVFVILDIVGVHKANYKITGLVLFAIFLNYGYYIWRAYILGRKKTMPIVYTVLYSLLGVVSVIVSVYYTMNMTFGIMNMMY